LSAVTTYDKYAIPAEREIWSVPMAGDTRFSWEYDDGRQKLLALYQKGKDKQWDQARRIDWSLPFDVTNPLDLPPEAVPIYGSKTYEKIKDDPVEMGRLAQHLTAWQFSQFLHGEQGAMICASRITEAVPDLDAKFYAATQVMDEARHAETYARFLQDKVQLLYPINKHLKVLLEQTLTDKRWDMPYLGMQVLIEGVALAAFGLLRDMTKVALPKQILAYVMQDEARHVAFGRLALRDYYGQLSDAERSEREEFVVEGCYLLRDRFTAEEVWETLGYDVDECINHVDKSPMTQMYRSLLFTRIVPCVKDIGLWGPKVQAAYADMGVTGYAATDLSALMEKDEELAEKIDAEKRAEREQEIADIIRLGAAQG
jgi:hypothetical protein